MFRTRQTDTFGTEITRLFGIFRCFGVRLYRQFFDFINPFHQRAEVSGQFNRYCRNLAFDNLALGAVNGNPVTFADNRTAGGLHSLGFIVDFDVRTARHTGRSHSACNHRRVRCHTATRRDNPLGRVHTRNVFG